MSNKPSKKGSRRLCINLNEKVADKLMELVNERNQSITEVIRHAINLLYLISKETRGGSKLVFRDEKGEVEKEILLPG